MSSQNSNPDKSSLTYRRVLLKISGEALMGEQNYGIDVDVARMVGEELKAVHELGVQIAAFVDFLDQRVPGLERRVGRGARTRGFGAERRHARPLLLERCPRGDEIFDPFVVRRGAIAILVGHRRDQA